jgi:DNA-binding response OmpR family regulator
MEKKRILIVEDELDFAELVKMRLETAGYVVSIAVDAYGGTQAVLKENFDLIILDLMMPAGGGLAIPERMRKFPGKSAVPIVVLTGQPINDELKEQLTKLKVSAVFAKPYDTTHFLTKIHSLLDHGQTDHR